MTNGEIIQTEEYMSAGEATAFLGISKTTMRNLLRAGVLPFRPSRVDGRIKMVKRSDVEALARESLRKSPKVDLQVA